MSQEGSAGQLAGRRVGVLEHLGCQQASRYAGTWRALLLRQVPTGPPSTPPTPVPVSPYQTSPGASPAGRLGGTPEPYFQGVRSCEMREASGRVGRQAEMATTHPPGDAKGRT